MEKIQQRILWVLFSFFGLIPAFYTLGLFCRLLFGPDDWEEPKGVRYNEWLYEMMFRYEFGHYEPGPLYGVLLLGFATFFGWLMLRALLIIMKILAKR